MTALKAHEVKRFLDRPDLTDGVFLAYGPDQGLVHETAMKLVRLLDNDGGAQAVTLDGDDLAKDAGPMLNELQTMSMFGGKRIVRVRNAGNKLAAALKSLGDLDDAALILEADALAPKDALRSVVEGMKRGRALPCFADSAETIASLIRQTFSDAGIKCDPDVPETLRDMLGNDREVTRRELEKLTLYAHSSKRITLQDVATLCADNGMMAIDDILDAAGSGDQASLYRALSRATAHGVDGQRVLIMASNHFANMRRLRVKVDEGQSPADALDSSRPKPHFSRKNILADQLRNLHDDQLSAIGERLLQATSDSRRKPALAQVLVERSLMQVCAIASRVER